MRRLNDETINTYHKNLKFLENYTSKEKRKSKLPVQKVADRFCAFTSLSGQRELDAQAEILRRRRITAARKQRCVRLTVIIETHRKQLAECIVGREAQLQGIVATARTACHRGDVAHNRRLLAETEVETQVQVVVGAIRTIAARRRTVRRVLVVSAIALLALRLHDLALGATAEEVEVVDAVAHT